MWFARKKIEDIKSPPFDEVRKRTRILVIDDDPNSFPFEILRKEGYAIDHWPKVENLSALETGQFDIIFLDIQGVAEDYCKEDGLGLLEHLKETNPSQIVVAFSAHSFDLSKNRFWKLADDSLDKPVEAAKCKRLIDNLIENKRTPLHYWQAIAELLSKQGLKSKEIASIESKVAHAIERKDPAAIRRSLESVDDISDIASRVFSIASKIASLLGWGG